MCVTPENISVVVEGSCKRSRLGQGIQVCLKVFGCQPTALKPDSSAAAREQTLQCLHIHTMKIKKPEHMKISAYLPQPPYRLTNLHIVPCLITPTIYSAYHTQQSTYLLDLTYLTTLHPPYPTHFPHSILFIHPFHISSFNYLALLSGQLFET